MKRFFFDFAVFTAMFFMVGCGGSSSGNNDGESYSECSYGSYRCKGGDSYWCGYTNSSNDLTWQLSEYCTYSCDDSTGKCSSSSSGGNGNEQHNDSCGNRIVDSNEVCDGDAKECSTISSLYTGGYAVCNSNCSGYDTSSCATGGGSGGGGSSGGSGDCYDIYECFFQCETDSCAQACFDNGSESGQNQFYDLYTCWQNNSCEYTDCDACYAKYSACVGGGNSGGGSGGGGSTAECYSGEYECDGSYSKFCSNGSWTYEYCSYEGCNYSTGRCNSGSGGGNGGGGSTSECSSGQYKCSGSYSYYCSYGSWTSDQYCSNGCDSSTGKCKSSSGGGGSTSECTSGQYKCSGSYSYYCSYGSWTSDQYCSNGCDSSTGKCKSSSGGGGSTTGNKPCIDDFNGAYTGTDSTYLELHWSLKQTGTCGKAEKVTLQVQVGSSYKTLTEKSAYLYDTYSFDAEPYFSSYPYQVYVSLEAKNSYGSTFWSIGCDYKENHFGDYDICYTILHY